MRLRGPSVGLELQRLGEELRGTPPLPADDRAAALCARLLRHGA